MPGVADRRHPARLLATALPEHGWRTVVLVPDLTAGACSCQWCADPSRPAPVDPPGTTVHRLPVRRSALRAAASLVRRTRRPGGATAGPSTGGRGGGKLSHAAWLLGDVHSTWARVAEAHADRLLADGGVDALWTTSAPFAHARVGHRLAEKHHLPWVADIRDPASTDVTAPPGLLEKAVRLRRRAYRRPLQAASAVTAATGQVALLDGPWLGRQPIVIVPGFDDREWAVARGRPARHRPVRDRVHRQALRNIPSP